MPVLLALLAAQAATVAAQADVPTAPTVVAHVGDCMAATNAAGIDFDLLTGRGWSRSDVRISGGSGPQMAFFTKAGDLTVLGTIQAGARVNDCVVISPVGDPTGIEAVRAALDSALAVERTSPTETETIWITTGHRVALARMSSAQMPGVRVTVRAAGRE